MALRRFSALVTVLMVAGLTIAPFSSAIPIFGMPKAEAASLVSFNCTPTTILTNNQAVGCTVVINRPAQDIGVVPEGNYTHTFAGSTPFLHFGLDLDGEFDVNAVDTQGRLGCQIAANVVNGRRAYNCFGTPLLGGNTTITLNLQVRGCGPKSIGAVMSHHYLNAQGQPAHSNTLFAPIQMPACQSTTPPPPPPVVCDVAAAKRDLTFTRIAQGDGYSITNSGDCDHRISVILFKLRNNNFNDQVLTSMNTLTIPRKTSNFLARTANDGTSCLRQLDAAYGWLNPVAPGSTIQQFQNANPNFLWSRDGLYGVIEGTQCATTPPPPPPVVCDAASAKQNLTFTRVLSPNNTLPAYSDYLNVTNHSTQCSYKVSLAVFNYLNSNKNDPNSQTFRTQRTDLPNIPAGAQNFLIGIGYGYTNCARQTDAIFGTLNNNIVVGSNLTQFQAANPGFNWDRDGLAGFIDGVPCAVAASSASSAPASSVISSSRASSIPASAAASVPASIASSSRISSVISSSRASSVPASVPASVASSAISTVDLSIVKQRLNGANTTVTRGDVFHYQITVTNNGQSATATNVSIRDPFANTLEFLGAGTPQSQTNAFCSLSEANTVTCSNFSLNSGDSRTFILSFRAANTACNGLIINTATVSTSTTDRTPNNNTSNSVYTNTICPASSAPASSAPASSAPASVAASSVALAPNLSIQKIAPPNAFSGQEVTYSFTATNANGAGVANNVRVVDFFISGQGAHITSPFQFLRGEDASCQFENITQQVVCNLGTMQPGAQRTFRMVFAVPQTGFCQQFIQNQVEIGLQNQSTMAGTSAFTVVSCPAVSSAASSTGPVPACRDGFDNDGDGLIDFPQDPGCLFPDDPDEFNQASSSSVASSAFSFANSSVFVASSASSAPASSAPASSAPASSVASSTAAGLGCIEIKNETFDPAGNPLSTTAQFTYGITGQTTQNNNSGIARFENVAPGTHTITQTSPNNNWQSLTGNTATVTVTAGSTCAGALFKNRQISVAPNFIATKTDSRTTANVNDTLVYSINVINGSNFEATNVLITDQLPAEVIFLSSSGGTLNGQTVTWTIPSIPVGQSRTVFVTVRVREGTPAGRDIINRAVIANGLASAEDHTTVAGGGTGNLEIDIDDDEDPIEPGDRLTYTITLRNPTNVDLRDLTILQILPDDVKVIDADDIDGQDADIEEDDDDDNFDESITWENVDIDADDEIEFEVEVEVDEDTNEDELITEVLADGESEEETTEVDDDGNNNNNNSNSDNGLSVTKNAPFEVFPGGIIEYEVIVENTGDEDLQDIIVSDKITGQSFTVIDAGGAKLTGGNRLEWTIDLDEGETETFRYRVAVDASAFVGQIIVNTVVAETEDEDEDSEGTASVTVSVIGELPQTGFGINRTGKSQFLRPYSGSQSTTAWAAIFSVIVAGLGTGAGVGMGRKFFA